MPAYIIADVDVTDPVRYEEYKKLAPPAIAKYGGRYLVRGGAHETLEGTWTPRRLVILEFPDLDRARAFYHSPEYAVARAARSGAATGNFVIVQGL
ncbi:MAG: DUF1330 domain-containing protein [Burkholderiales bacterium]|nr:DUF1330 domain-containing protein [Burkholderiales bacterium]